MRFPALQAPTVPDPGAFSGYDDLGIVAILVFVIFLDLAAVVGIGVLFFKRIWVWGSTTDLLVANEARRADLKEQEAEEWKASCRRIAEDGNANLERALTLRDEVLRRRRKDGEA